MADKFTINEKIRLIRYFELTSRKEFSDKTGIPKRAIENIENNRANPKGSYLQAICSSFPHYTLWLIINEIDIESGQISPMIKGLWEKWTFIDKDPNAFDRNSKKHIEEIKWVIEERNNGKKEVQLPFHSSFFTSLR